MKKHILFATSIVCSSLMAQTQFETYTASDVNHNNSVDVEDVTQVVNSSLGTATEGNVVDAAELNEVLQNIYQLLGKLDNLETKVSEIDVRLRYLMQKIEIGDPYPDENGIIANGHKYVDLGLKDEQGHTIYWATCNVGADKPEDTGLYFAWGETEGYTEDTNDGRIFNWANYKWCTGSYNTMTKYCTYNNNGTVDNKDTLSPEDDAAHVNWGGDWRMPTKVELEQLSTECTWTWNYMKMGYTVKGPNGNSIFLPAADCRNDSYSVYPGRDGYYWSSSILNELNPHLGSAIYFYIDNKIDDLGFHRYLGLSVRAVCGSPE